MLGDVHMQNVLAKLRKMLSLRAGFPDFSLTIMASRAMKRGTEL